MSKRASERKLIYKGSKNNIFIKFWNWGFNIYYDNREFWNYVIVGALTTVIAIGSKMLLLKTLFDQTNGLELQYAETISWILAVLFAFIMNRIIVFKSKSKKIIKEFFSFVSGRIFTQVIQMLIIFVFCTYFGLNTSLWILIWTFICQIMQIFVNYFISKLIVFKKGE